MEGATIESHSATLHCIITIKIKLDVDGNTIKFKLARVIALTSQLSFHFKSGALQKIAKTTQMMLLFNNVASHVTETISGKSFLAKLFISEYINSSH